MEGLNNIVGDWFRRAVTSSVCMRGLELPFQKLTSINVEPELVAA